MVQPPLHTIIAPSLSHPAIGVRYSALMLIRSISRDVAMTHIVLGGSDGPDGQNGIGKRVLEIVGDTKEDRRVVGAALAAVCNLVTDCSPLRDVSSQHFSYK